MRRGRSALTDIGLAALIVYLAVNTVVGRHGLWSHMELQARERVLAAQLHDLEARRATLAAETTRLTPGSIDWDYVEERARRFLHLARREEVLLRVGTGA